MGRRPIRSLKPQRMPQIKKRYFQQRTQRFGFSLEERRTQEIQIHTQKPKKREFQYRLQ